MSVTKIIYHNSERKSVYIPFFAKIITCGYFAKIMRFKNEDSNMLAFLPSPVLLLLNCILIPLNCIVIATPIMILGLIRILIPLSLIANLCEQCNFWLYRIWVFDNAMILKLTNNIKWHISGDKIPKIKKSCVVISNHLSWADIIILCCVYRGRIPTTKFFMKHSLIYIPFVGLACYALGMPFLRRYSREKLLKDPKLRNADIESTKKACRRLATNPSSLINFVEGTRFTPVKAKLARSQYQNLMPPKAASVAIALGEIGKDIDYVFNTTLVYPHNRYPSKPFIDLLKGKLKDVYADIELVKVTPEISGDYLGDKAYKHQFTMHLRDVWQEKDEKITKILKDSVKKAEK